MPRPPIPGDSPKVIQEGVSWDRVGVGDQCGHTVIDEEAQRRVVELSHRRLEVELVSQNVLRRRPLELPVVCKREAERC